MRVIAARGGVTGAVVVGALLMGGRVAPSVVAQDVRFRSSVDVIAVDVQVVDKAGHPFLDLRPGDFTVAIQGRARPVVSVDLVRYAEPTVLQPRIPLSGPVASNVWPSDAHVGRDVVLGVDSGGFDVGSWQRTVEMSRRFIGTLEAGDRLGLYVYPSGPRLTPTIDHARVLRALDAVPVGGRPLETQFNLRPTEIVDITAEMVRVRTPGSAARRVEDGVDTPTVQAVQMRECPQDANCSARILLDASSAAQQLQSRVMESVAGLKGMVGTLAEWPGRKTVVLLTAGVLVSDRPGGQPDAVDVSRVLGEGIAATNAAIYTVHVDSGFWSGYSAVRRSLSRTGSDQAREVKMYSQWLETFSDAAGGTLLRVDQTYDSTALLRVLRETSAHYVLGVEPADADRDGRLRTVHVRVSRAGATVRSRTWVAVPKAKVN